jgi:hypothetical protein
MRHPGYHGGFEHPVRSFVIGTTLLVLLFFGFVAGIELGSPPAGSATTTRLVEGTGQTVLVPTTETKTISVPSSAQVKWRVIDGEKYVIIHQPGKKQVVYKVKYLPSEITSDGTSAAAAAAVRLVTVEVPTVTTETVTSEVPVTVTDTVTETVTETVTGPGTTDTQGPPGS